MSDEPPHGFELLPPQYARSFIAHIGPFHRRFEDGVPCIGVRLRHEHCNPFGEAHGGFICGMADFVCAYHMLAGPDPTPSVTTIQIGTQMMASARFGEWLEGCATLRRKGRTIACVGCDFTVGDRVVAHTEAVFRVLSDDGVQARMQRRRVLHSEC